MLSYQYLNNYFDRVYSFYFLILELAIHNEQFGWQILILFPFEDNY